MYLTWIPVLISAIAGCFAVTMVPKPIHVMINSSNFDSILHWASQGPRDSMYDVDYQIYGEAWVRKAECYRTSEHRCDLTGEFAQESNWYYARVRTVWRGSESAWTLSERFCPLDKTVIGPPEVRLAVRARSIDIWVEPPTVHPRDGRQRSIEDIFSVVQYKVQLSEAATNKMVFVALNDNGNFTVESLDPSTKYCGTTKLVLKRDIFSKESQTAGFCGQTEREWTLMIVLLVTALVMVGVLTTGTFVWVAHSYTTLHRTLPHALDLDKILMKKHSSVKHCLPGPHLVTSQKDEFHFAQITHVQDIGLFKSLSHDKTEILIVGELGLARLLGSYAPQHHSRSLQPSVPTASPRDIQTDRSLGLVDNGWYSPYCPQRCQHRSNPQASGQDGSPTQAEKYTEILHTLSPSVADASRDSPANTHFPLTAMQLPRDGLPHKVDRQISCQRPDMEMEIPHTMEGKPTPLLSLLEHNGDADWKRQPLEVSSLEGEVQSCPLLLHYRPRVWRDTLLSTSEDEHDAWRVRGEGVDEEGSATNVLPCYSHLCSPLLGQSSVQAQLVPTWDDGCQAQLPSLFSLQREGQPEVLPTGPAVERNTLLAGWEIRVQADE